VKSPNLIWYHTNLYLTKNLGLFSLSKKTRFKNTFTTPIFAPHKIFSLTKKNLKYLYDALLKINFSLNLLLNYFVLINLYDALLNLYGALSNLLGAIQKMNFSLKVTYMRFLVDVFFGVCRFFPHTKIC
jgi:hypothetical protein